MGATAITAIKNLIGRVWKNNRAARAARSYEQVCALCPSGFGPPLELDPGPNLRADMDPPRPYPLADLDPSTKLNKNITIHNFLT